MNYFLNDKDFWGILFWPAGSWASVEVMERLMLNALKFKTKLQILEDEFSQSFGQVKSNLVKSCSIIRCIFTLNVVQIAVELRISGVIKRLYVDSCILSTAKVWARPILSPKSFYSQV